MENINAVLGSKNLIRAGLQHLESARTALEQLCGEGLDERCVSHLLESIAEVCDPDMALRSLQDIIRSYHQRGARLRQSLPEDSQLSNLIGVLGVSKAMGFLMMSRPDLVESAGRDPHGTLDYDAAQRCSTMLAASGCRMEAEDGSEGERNNCERYGNAAGLVNAEEDSVGTDSTGSTAPYRAAAPSLPDAVNGLRREYYRQLAAIMAFDARSHNPIDIQPKVSTMLSALADAALEAALSIAKRNVEHGDVCRFAIIGMGKLGSKELNYVSDVDLIYVVEPAAEGVDNQRLIRVGSRIATMLQKICQSVIPGVTEPALWQIDGGLRPEGKDGPLVRRLQSHLGYYEQWAESWEFQALLKARPVAGDAELGKAYYGSTRPFVWSASKRSNFVYDCQRMRKRVESLIPDALKDREIKLGRGGLRDVEFTVQMLQLVHGRTDSSLRTASTLESLRALADGGYVSRRQATQLSQDYRFERVLEHRQQMWELKRTHLFPDMGKGSYGGMERVREITREELDANVDLRRLARAFNIHPDELMNRFDATRREIRRLHQDIYYRPMLPISAQTQTEDIRLSSQAAEDRFASIGFADPQSAMRHVESLTTGLSRASKINRILLPAVLEWLGEGQNPDMGLLGWRSIEERFGTGSQYLGFLRDSPSAAQRLCHILSNSRFLGEALRKSSESITWLGNDQQLQLRSDESLRTQTRSAVERFADRPAEFANSIRAMRRHEIERIGLGWMSHVLNDNECLQGMTDVYDAILSASLRWAIERQADQSGVVQSPAKLVIVAMGRYGGNEVNFSSDADIIAVYEPNDGVDPREANLFALHVLDDMRLVLSGAVSVEEKIDLDMDLRPEGKNGPLVRSYESCREYYHSWASTWESQALLRARVAAGDTGLGDRLMSEVIDPIRYPRQTLHEEQIAEIRRLKARMEAERLPRGVRRDRHIKLGKGGLSDIEWTVQLHQLQHANEISTLRTTSTLPALEALRDAGLINAEDADNLREAWMLCTAARNGNYLWSGRASRADILPDDGYSLGGIGIYLGYAAHQGQRFENDMLGKMRRCREITDRLFYGIM
ncbi:MAG: bifunctional [glutamine synthetase] adenylyltransferase/[glutamine synthetase]-adenylyl-L-tyrosine phosphorylase [Bifidobacterium sp.]|uniref:Bifunctional [glutamine synthetase] adenylyltransferase/[glutamine synthetase]-adenylyl-L-tyrosine phosphorylase n=1 Tax=Bifidobacterium fermentum TaxID=3059035 RepID=A0AB39U9P3_9BIFI